MHTHRLTHRAGALGAIILTLTTGGCVTLEMPGSPGAQTTRTEPVPEGLLEAADFAVWDMHANGTDPARSEKIIDPALARRGYWLSSSFLGMPRREEGARMGAGGKTIDTANLPEREQVLRQRLQESGIARLTRGTGAMVMLDAEAFKPWESAQALAWYNQTARVANEYFDQWFWYFQPGRAEGAVPERFADEDAFFAWFMQQDFITRASAISVTVYHGRDQDAHNPKSAGSRMENDRHLKRAILFAERLGKPLIITVRADLGGKPRETIMSRSALEASWRPAILRDGVAGIAIWNSQPPDKIDLDRQWASTRIEPVLRTLLEERAAGNREE